MGGVQHQTGMVSTGWTPRLHTVTPGRGCDSRDFEQRFKLFEEFAGGVEFLPGGAPLVRVELSANTGGRAAFALFRNHQAIQHVISKYRVP